MGGLKCRPEFMSRSSSPYVALGMGVPASPMDVSLAAEGSKGGRNDHRNKYVYTAVKSKC